MQTNDTAYFIREWNHDVLTWNEALLNYDMCLKNNSLVKSNDNGFFVTHQAYKIDSVKKIMNENDFTQCHLYFNITTNARTFGKHNDDDDVWFWQCQGVTKWIIEDKDEIVLNPGDLIYVPEGVNHSVEALTPRLGVSFGKGENIW